MVEPHGLLVVIGLIVNFGVLVFATKKFVILDNVFMIYWKRVTLGLVFTLLGFFIWFIAEVLEILSVFLYKQLLIVCFFLLSLGQIVHLLILHKRVTKSAL